MQRTFLISSVIITLFAGCSKNRKDAADWSEHTLVAQYISLNDNNLKLSGTISIPQGLHPDKKHKGPGFAAWLSTDRLAAPSVSVILRKVVVTDLGKARELAKIPPKMQVSKALALSAHRFLFVYHSAKKSVLFVKYYMNRKGMLVECRASQAKNGGLPSFEATAAYLEKVCTSLKID